MVLRLTPSPLLPSVVWPLYKEGAKVFWFLGIPEASAENRNPAGSPSLGHHLLPELCH